MAEAEEVVMADTEILEIREKKKKKKNKNLFRPFHTHKNTHKKTHTNKPAGLSERCECEGD